MRTWNGKNGDSKKSVYLSMQEAAPHRQNITNRQPVNANGTQIRRNSDLDMKNKLKGTKEINGYMVRPGFFRMNGAHAAENGVSFTINTHNATSVTLLLFRNEENNKPYYYNKSDPLRLSGSVTTASEVVDGLDNSIGDVFVLDVYNLDDK